MFEEFLAYLDESGVRFIVVGGLAVVIHGHARLTADIDLVLDLDSENVHRAIDALTARGLRPLLPVNAADFADESKRREWLETRNLQVFSMRDERNPVLTVDLFAEEPIPFGELWSAASEVIFGGRTIRVQNSKRLHGDAVSAERREPASIGECDGGFDAAAERTLDASLAVTPSERLRWLEEALAFATKVGALPDRRDRCD